MRNSWRNIADVANEGMRRRCECEEIERPEREEGERECGREEAAERRCDSRCEFARFIKRKFRGTHITLTIVGDDEKFCGEVVDVFDCIIALKKHDGLIIFINAVFVSTFY